MKKTTINSKADAINAIKKAVDSKKQTADSKKQTAEKKVVIDFTAVKKALADIDSRFVVYDDNIDKACNYCSIRLLLKDNAIDSRRVFCLYYNASSVCIHCAVRFESVCSNVDYHLNTRKSEYTKSVSLDDLVQHVNALIAHEIARLKLDSTTATEATAEAIAEAK